MCDSEHALAVKTAVRAENVAVGVEPEEIAKALYGDGSAKFHDPLLVARWAEVATLA